MPRCPDCGLLISVHHTQCPACSGTDRETEEERFAPQEMAGSDMETAGERVSVARFQNGAEAGYFAEELTHQTGIDVQIVAREQFNHMWSTDYLLMVPAADAQDAAQALRALVQSTTEEDGDAVADGRFPEEEQSLAGPVWISVVVTLAAGSLAWWGMHRVEQRPRPPALVMRERRPPPDLYEFLKTSPTPWVQRLDSGIRELQIDPDARAATVREDRDGDGNFERRWEFQW